MVARTVVLLGVRLTEGDSGRLNGDGRGEPMPSGEGFLGEVLVDLSSMSASIAGTV